MTGILFDNDVETEFLSTYVLARRLMHVDHFYQTQMLAEFLPIADRISDYMYMRFKNDLENLMTGMHDGGDE